MNLLFTCWVWMFSIWLKIFDFLQETKIKFELMFFFRYMYLWTKYTAPPRAMKVPISSVYNISWWITDVLTSHKVTFSFSQLNCSEEMSVSQINEHPLWVNHCSIVRIHMMCMICHACVVSLQKKTRSSQAKS